MGVDYMTLQTFDMKYHQQLFPHSPSLFSHRLIKWALFQARPLQDLNVLLHEPLLCCLGCVFWVIVMLEYPSTTHFQCPGPDGTWAPSIVPLMRCSCPVPLAEKHPQSIMFPPPCWQWVWCSWMSLSSSSKHRELSWCQRLDFGLIWPQHFHTPVLLWIIQMFIGKLQTGLYMCFLEQGDLAGTAGFQSSRRSVFPIVFLMTMVPAALRLLTRSSL